MSRREFRGPRLPQTLIDQVEGSNGASRRHSVPRRDQRKAERQQKKQSHRPRPPPTRIKPQARNAQHNVRQNTHAKDAENEQLEDDFGFDSSDSPEPLSKKPVANAQPTKSILKRTLPPVQEPVEDSEGDVSDASDASSFVVSARAAKDGLADNDAEIAALEKKLGIKGGKKSKAEDDELDWLIGGSESESESANQGLKRKRPEDEQWLRAKRSKAARAEHATKPDVVADSDETSEVSGSEDQDSEDGDIANPFSPDELDSDDLESDDADEEGHPLPKKVKENPYIAPASNVATPAKYVPPSLRKPATSDEEVVKQLRRQIQGQLNRLSEANIISILQAIEELYTRNARQNVTSTVVDLMIGLIADPSTLNDTFLILHAGFCTAMYKVVGIDFGAQLLEALIESYEKNDVETNGKQCLNILAFASCLYNFQMLGSTIIFDFIRTLLVELSEQNTELLLRIIRTSGPQLRQDDPSSLKDIVLLLQRSVAEKGEESLSVRTKFMMETINSLKNNRLKGGAAASALATEHTTRMKKALGTLNPRAKATEPLRISLADVKDSEKKGKWWLVGASYHDPAKMAKGDESTFSKPVRNDDDGYESETPGHVNLQKLARQQGMNTDVRRSIFINILSAADFIDAHMRLLKLHLKSKQQLEIPRVLVHCVGSEQVYNPYYALIARKFCGEHHLRKAFSFNLWDAFKQMDEASKDEEYQSDDERGSGASGMSVRKIVNLAKFYGTLVVHESLDIAILKKLDFAYLSSSASMFVEVLLTTIFTQAYSTEDFEKATRSVFAKARRAPQIVQGLAFFIQTTVAKAELAKRKKEARAVREGCRIAIEALEEVKKHAAPIEEEDDDEEDDEED